jgi:beta-lactamase class A
VGAVLLLVACTAPADPGPTDPPPTAASSSPTSADPASPPTPADLTGSVVDGLVDLERSSGARVGVYAVDTGSGEVVTYRADERFGYASTLKALAAGELLRGQPVAALDEALPLAAEDVAEAGYAPVTGARVGERMTVRELGAAAVSESDNGALNVLLRRLGGPEALQAALVAAGDSTTLVDAGEPDLNRFTPGDPARTSTPRALGEGLRRYALGDALAPEVRDVYTGWLTGSTTGDATIRAGAPAGWVVGGKTGSAGRYGSRNDVAVVWPPDRDPVVLAVLTDRPEVDAEPDDAVLADVAAVVLAAYGG